MKPNVPSAFQRQFHKGNFEKIYIVKWSQRWMYVAISMNSGVSKNKTKKTFGMHFHNFKVPLKKGFCQQKSKTT